MDQVTTGSVPEDEQLERFGYRQQFARSLRHFESFAVAFSFISITTGIFTTYAFALATGGTRSIWTWPIVIAGQALVALVYGALSIRVPLSGYSYQWASRLANPHVGWWFGWMSFAFLTIVTVSVDYGLVQVAFQPLIGQTYTPTSAALETLVVLALQAAFIVTSTRTTTRVNNAAVATEIIGIVGLTVLLLIVAAVRSLGHWSNLTSTGPVPSVGYYAWLGPFMLATLLGAYTIVGFESASNLAEETHEPHRVIPKAMLRAVLVSGVVGFAFLIALAYATNKAAYASTAPVASIVHDVLGGVVQKIFLVFVCVSIFACGLIIMVTNSRLIFSMSRDRRLPGHQLLHQVPRATGGPPWATILAAVLSGAIALALRTHTAALTTLFTASTIMPALLYAGTVLLYVATARRRGAGESQGTTPRSFGKFELPIVAGAVIWLAYELIILIGPGEFRDAQYYVLGALGVGLVFYMVQLVTEREAMRKEPGSRVNVLAIDQGTSATKALLVGPGGRGARPRRGPGPHPQRRRGRGGGRPGGAVRVGRGGGPAGARGGAGAGPRGGAGQPGRDRAGLGPSHRCSAVPGDRLAGPAVWRRVRAARGPFGRTDRDHRPAARPVLRRAEDDLAAGEPDRRRHRHHHRQLAAGPARRRVRDRRRHRVPDPAARPGPRGLVADGLRGLRPGPGGAAGGGGLRRGSSARRPRSGARCRSPGSPWTSRPRCWPRAAWPRATPSAPTGRARSCWSPPAVPPSGPSRDCPRRWHGGWAAR